MPEYFLGRKKDKSEYYIFQKDFNRNRLFEKFHYILLDDHYVNIDSFPYGSMSVGGVTHSLKKAKKRNFEIFLESVNSLSKLKNCKIHPTMSIRSMEDFSNVFY